MFGKTRQAYYHKEKHQDKKFTDELLVLDMVKAVRREIPGLGTPKLYLLLHSTFKKSGIKMGRDKLHALLQSYHLIITRKPVIPRTTNSCHWMKKYPNLIREKMIDCTESVWVADLMYLFVGFDFNYLSLITDAHSHLIVGYCLHDTLSTDGSLIALEMALNTRNKSGNSLIHHSDRGSQYCSFKYTTRLRESNIKISMTENGDPYENAIAERVNGILKSDFRLSRVFNSRMEALSSTEAAIRNYNNLRPHMSCDYMTPARAHQLDLPVMKKRWK